MLENLLTEQVNPASSHIDSLPTTEVLRIINDADAQVAPAVASEIGNIARAVDAIVERMRAGGRLFYIGAGTSGRLGVLDAAECPPTFNVPPEMVQAIIAGGEPAVAHPVEASEDDPRMGERDLLERGFSARDVLVGIAASGRTPYVLGAVEAAERMAALTIGISCSPDSELARRVAIAITPLPGPEVIAGSTRMRAGTATKLVLNMISTSVMIRMGCVYGNLMVNVQPKNSKLRDRAERILVRATGISSSEASALLKAAGDSVRTAIVMSRRGVGREEAERLLAKMGNRVSAALGEG